MYDQFLAKSFHNPDFGDQQFGDVNNQNNNNTGQVGRDVRGMTPNSDSNDRQNLSQNRQVAVSTGMSPSPETPHQAPGYPPNFFSAPMSQEQLYNARLSYSQHINYQQYKQQLMHQMGAYNPLEMLQQGYGMGPPAPPQQQISAPPPVQQQQQPSPQQQQQQQQQTQQQQQQPPPQQQHTVPEIVNEDSDDSVAQAQMYAGMKRPSPDNCFVNNNQKKPKPQKKKKKKDPNEPQKPVSAYALFFRDTQAAIKGQNPNASFGEVSKIVASMWDTLDVEHKNVYKRKTEDAKKDYLKALAAYRASLVSKSGRECETNTPQQINSGFPASNNVYNGYNQHGYSPPTSVAGGTEHHNQNQRVTHHHQGYSPPPSKIEHGTQHTQHLHHGYSQTPGGGVMTDNRATQLSHPYNQQSNQDHRMAHHHHGYSPTAQQDSKSSHSSYSSSSSGPSPGSFNDSHSNSQERNSQLGTHYHGYSPPRSLADASHQINPQYVTAGHGRLPGNYQNANDNSRMTNNYQNSGNVNENQSRMTNNVNTHYQNESMQNNQQNSNYQDNVRSHHHYPQLGNSSSQGDIRQNQSQQTGNQAHHYSASPGSNAQETHQASSQTGGYQTNQSNETHHQMSTQTYSQPNNEHQMHTNSQSTQYPNPSGETHHHAGTQSGYHSPNTEHHQQHNYQQQNNDMHRMHHYQQQYNGYSPRYDGYSPSGSLPSPASQTQPIMNQECIQQQPQQSQVMVGRHMAGPTPGAQHMTPIHQPPTM